MTTSTSSSTDAVPSRTSGDDPAVRWAGRLVLVTGATRGIGRACATRFGRHGAQVVVHGRDQSAAERVVLEIAAAGGRATAVLGDLREAAFCERLVDNAGEFGGRIDVLVNNAGANVFKGTLAATIEDWNSCLDLDVRAAWLCSKNAVARMSPGSSIVNLSSNHAGATLPGAFPYNVAKAALNALTQALAIELADRRIRVNTVAPGYVDTPINDAYFSTFDDPARARANAERLHPLERLGRPDEIAAAVEFLADDRCSGFTTGSTLTIDGGRAALLEDPGAAADPPTETSRRER